MQVGGFGKIMPSWFFHRHLRDIYCLMAHTIDLAHTACLVCFISTVNGRSKKRKKKAYYERR
jgi:hypothetical protein